MSSPLDTPIVSPALVGRAAHLAALERAADQAWQGHGSTILVSGEAGIGKSRLIREASSQFQSRASPPLTVLRGNCFEPDQALAYAPLLDLLRSWLAGCSGDDVAAAIGPDIREFVRLLPELGRVFPDARPLAAVDPEAEKHGLFQALLRFLTRLAETGPLLVIIEDLHWSDDLSLDFLLHLARRISTRRILLLLSYRNDQVQPALAHMLALLDRERLAAELALPRFNRAEVDLMLRSIFQEARPIRADFLQAIHALTDGNPFFIEEVVRSLLASGDIVRAGEKWQRRELPELHIPRSIHDAVTQRTRHLSPDAREVLRLAAAAGQRFDFAVLQALTGHDEPHLLHLIRELVGAQLVVEESADRFAFRHSLTRQAVYTGMLARERRALHLAIGEAIERLHADMPEPYLADLAYHFHAAEAWPKALEYAEQAGKQAQQMHAPRAVVEHLTRALDATARLALTPPSHLYRERGLAYTILGEFESARRDHESALEAARQANDRRTEWQSLIDLGGLWAGYDYDRAGSYFTRALDLAQEIGDPRVLARTRVQIGNWQLNVERPSEAEQALTAALAIFEESGDRAAMAETIDLLAMASDIGGDLAQMRERLHRAAALYREVNDRRGLSSVLASLVTPVASIYDVVVVPDDLPEAAVRYGEEAVNLAREIGWRAGEVYALESLAMYHTARCDFGRALEILQEALAIAQEIEHREWMTVGHGLIGAAYLDLLDYEVASRCFEQALDLARESGSRFFVHQMTGWLASTHIWRHDLEAAEAVLARVDPQLLMEGLGQRRVWTTRAILAIARGSPAEALDIIDRLYATAANVSSPGDIPLLARLRGDALAALGRVDEAEQAYQASCAGATERGLRQLKWRAHAALGSLYRSLGRTEDAAVETGAARAIVTEIAASIPEPGLRDAFVDRATALIGPERRSRGEPGFSLLTPREREVATLVASGKSNRDIAEALFIGERTVETHVGNILGKLNFTSRAQIAAWAVECGLVGAVG